MKALGTGHSRGVLWKDIEVFRQGATAATAVARRRRAALRQMRARRSLLTITHSEALAMAQVILLGD